MENTIKIITLTDFQKYIYANFVEIQSNLISNIKGWSAITLHQKHNKNHTDNFPRVTLLQLNSIPDYINGVFLDYGDKQNILLGEIENVKSYSKTLETFKIDENNNLQYINLNSNPIIIRNLTTLDTLTFESHTTPKFTKDGEEVLKAKIIPATSEQKMQFLEHIQSLMYNLIPVVPYPVLTTEQLDSIPDFIDGKELNTINKTQLLFEHFVPFSKNSEGSISDLKTYTVSNKGELIKTFEYKDKKNRFENTYKKEISFVKKEDCIYVNRNLSQNNSTSDLVNEPTAIYKQTKKNDMKLDEKVKVIPATQEQKAQYSRHIDDIDEFEFSDLPKEEFPLFSKEQLDSVPDIIEGFTLTDYDKRLLLVDKLEQSIYGIQYRINDDNNITSTFLTVGSDEDDNGQETKFITKKDVHFDKQEKENIFQTLNKINSEKVKGILEPKESDKVKVIPATQEQKAQYSRHIDGSEFSDIPKEDFPSFSKEQLDSVPDIIEGFTLTDYDKRLLLVDELEQSIYGIQYRINDDNNITSTFLTVGSDEDDIGQETKFITKKDVHFDIFQKLNKINSEKIKIVPATDEQKKKYLEYVKINLKIDEDNPTKLTDEEIYVLKTENYKKNFPELSKEQIHSVPQSFKTEYLDNVESTAAYFKITEDQKKLILLGDRIDFYHDYKGSHFKETLALNENNEILVYSKSNEGKPFFLQKQDVAFPENINNLKRDFLIIDNQLFEITSIRRDGKICFEDINNQDKTYTTDLEQIRREKLIHLEDVTLEEAISLKEKITLKTINIMSTNVDFDKAKDLDVVGFERPLKVNDPVAIVHDGKNLQGKVVGFQENGDINLLISNSRDIKDLTVKGYSKIEPMFILNKKEEMVYLKFTYEEAKAALYNKIPGIQDTINFKPNKDEKSPVFNLMLGNKTDVIPFEKNIDNKMVPVEGRLELRRKAGSGEAYVHGEVKHKELNLSLPIYGLHLNDQQKEDLTNKKDIGLVQGFKSNDGKEFALWVSLDDKLNKVVTAPERSININMIFGVKTTEEQRNQIKSGEGAVVEIKGKEYLFQASAATTKADGLKSKAIENTKDLKQNQTQEVAKEEKKSKSKGLKI